MRPTLYAPDVSWRSVNRLAPGHDAHKQSRPAASVWAGAFSRFRFTLPPVDEPVDARNVLSRPASSRPSPNAAASTSGGFELFGRSSRAYFCLDRSVHRKTKRESGR